MTNREPHRRPVLLVRPDSNEADVAALAAVGLASTVDPYLHIQPTPGPEPKALLKNLESSITGDWLLVTSPRAIPAWAQCVGQAELTDACNRARERGVRAACPGAASARSLNGVGFDEPLIAAEGTARAMLALLRAEPAATALFPCGDIARPDLPSGLRDLGWRVSTTVVYSTTAVTQRPASADLIVAGEVSAIILRSPSAARAVAAFARPPGSVALICAGPSTTQAARELGLQVAGQSGSPSSAEVANLTRSVLRERQN